MVLVFIFISYREAVSAKLMNMFIFDTLRDCIRDVYGCRKLVMFIHDLC